MLIPYTIAEIGSCHQHDKDATIDLMKDLKDLGVDAVKFQYWSNGAELARQRHQPLHADALTEFQTEFPFLAHMADVARALELSVICSVFLQEDIEALGLQIDNFKLASLEAHDHQLLRKVNEASLGRAIFVSTGCHGQSQIASLRRFAQEVPLNSQLIILHCITAYPAPIDELNLLSMQNNRLDGFSDHSAHPLAGAVATLLGAQYLEFHVKHEKTSMKCPDYSHSLSIDEVAVYLANIEDVVKMAGSRIRDITPTEERYLDMRRG